MGTLAPDSIILKDRYLRLRGNPDIPPRASIVIPVNAQKDLENILRLAADISRYAGISTFELIIVVNNYPPDQPPSELEAYRQIGFSVIALPRVEHKGGVAIAARIPGVAAARSDSILLFDADCQIPNPTALLDWYVSQLEKGTDLAYTHVDYTDLPAGWSVKVRMFIHHTTRWFRRSILGIPTTRGSNYGIKRRLMLDLYAQGRLPYDILVGPVVRSTHGRIAYSASKELIVYTSGRFFSGSWKELLSYLKWRIGYYRRVGILKFKKILPL
jgi:glycosyltransferase involved in cell wall biosynthesis